MDDLDIKAMSVHCTLCRAAAHRPCRDERGRENAVPHIARIRNWERINKKEG